MARFSTLRHPLKPLLWPIVPLFFEGAFGATSAQIRQRSLSLQPIAPLVGEAEPIRLQ